MLWLEDEKGNEALPTLWDREKCSEDSDGEKGPEKYDGEKGPEESLETKSQKIAYFADSLIQGSLKKAACSQHDDTQEDCDHCQEILRMVSTFQCHSHKKSCFKKRRKLRINEDEGHGRLDGKTKESGMTVDLCRYNFPKNPSDETCFIHAFPKDHPKEEVKKATEDYSKIRKFMLRLTNKPGFQSSEEWEKFQSLTFSEFLYAVGMYGEDVEYVESDLASFAKAKRRYLEAMRMEVKSTGYILLKRSTKDVFINNFNKFLATIHPANHDLQFITDPYAVLEYVTGD